MHGPHTFCVSPLVMHVVVPSLQMPMPRFARSPGQHAAICPSVVHGQPSRFLSSGHSTVPPGVGGLFPPSGPHHIGGGSFAQNASGSISESLEPLSIVKRASPGSVPSPKRPLSSPLPSSPFPFPNVLPFP